MKRREFITLFLRRIRGHSWPRAKSNERKSERWRSGGSKVATLQGVATVTRANAAPAALKVSDAIFKNDALQTGASSSLGVTFDDETTLSLSANARIVVNEFVYEEGGKGNSAVFNIARGTVAFVASLVAKTGNMTISTPTAKFRNSRHHRCLSMFRITLRLARARPKSNFIRMPTGVWAR